MNSVNPKIHVIVLTKLVLSAMAIDLFANTSKIDFIDNGYSPCFSKWPRFISIMLGESTSGPEEPSSSTANSIPPSPRPR